MTWWPWLKVKFEAWLERRRGRRRTDGYEVLLAGYEGERLDAYVSAFGLSRAPGETDAALRDRAIYRLTEER